MLGIVQWFCKKSCKIRKPLPYQLSALLTVMYMWLGNNLITEASAVFLRVFNFLGSVKGCRSKAGLDCLNPGYWVYFSGFFHFDFVFHPSVLVVEIDGWGQRGLNLSHFICTRSLKNLWCLKLRLCHERCPIPKWKNPSYRMQPENKIFN